MFLLEKKKEVGSVFLYYHCKVAIMESKIFIVIAVIAVIFTGLVVWLFKLDRKVSRLEKEQQERLDH